MAKFQYKERTITCQGCQQTVTRRMPAGRNYCSLTCYRTSERPERKTGIEKQCGQCSASVYVSQRAIKPINFCSTQCQNRWQGRSKLNFICKICGIAFRWSKSRIKQTNPTYCSPQCRDKDPERYERLIQMNVIQQTMKTNGLEVKGYTLLDELRISYERQALLFDKFCVDAVLEDRKIVIQFDGDYWHGNENRFDPLTDRQQKRKRLDTSQDAYLRKCGYTVIRIWECDLKRHTHQVKQSLHSFLVLKEQIPVLDLSNHLVI